VKLNHNSMAVSTPTATIDLIDPVPTVASRERPALMIRPISGRRADSSDGVIEAGAAKGSVPGMN
jgi:hypothetical protein